MGKYQNTIKQAKKEYAIAYKNNDYVGMRNANKKANAARRKLGQKEYSSAKGDKQRASTIVKEHFTNKSDTSMSAVDQGYKSAMKSSPSVRGYFGWRQGFVPGYNLEKQYEQKYGKDTVDDLRESKAYKAGKVGGELTQYAIGYGAGGGVVGSIPKLAAMEGVGGVLARSALTSLAVEPLHQTGSVVGKQGKRGGEAVKEITKNTAINTVLGLGFEGGAIGVKKLIGKRIAKKAAKRVANLKDEIRSASREDLHDIFKNATDEEKEIAIRTLAEERNIVRGKVKESDAIFYGSKHTPSDRLPIADLPEPIPRNVHYTKMSEPVSKGVRGVDTKKQTPEQLIYNRNFQGKSGKEYKVALKDEIESSIENGIVSVGKSPLNDVDPLDYKKYIKQYAEVNLITRYDSAGNMLDAKPITIKSDGKQVVITKTGINDVLKKIRGGVQSKKNGESVLVLDKLIENSKLQGRLPNLKNRENPYSYYVTKFINDGIEYDVRIAIKETPDISRYHYHNISPAQVESIKITEAKPYGAYTHTSDGNLPRETSVTDNISHNANKVNETGELKDLGADTNRYTNTYRDALKKYGKMDYGEQLLDEAGNPITKQVKVPKATDYGDTQQHARTILESEAIGKKAKKAIKESLLDGSFAKYTRSNQVSVSNANNLIKEKGPDGAYNEFKALAGKDLSYGHTQDNIALGYRLIQEFEAAGKYKKAADVASDVSFILSETGRALQAARIIKRLSPEGRLMTVQRVVDKIRTQGHDVELTEEMVKKILNAKGRKQAKKAMDEVVTDVWSKVPPTRWEKANALRYLAMLANPKTHIRNILGNAMFIPARTLKDMIGTGLEKATIKEGMRTKSILNRFSEADRSLLEYAEKDFDEMKHILKGEGKFDNTTRPLEAKVFKNKILETLRVKNMDALDAEDTIFMKSAYKSSFARYMKANKLTADNMTQEWIDSAREYATNEALKATYRDFSKMAEIISNASKKGLKSDNLAIRAGSIALEGALPFKKTPINILKRGVEYSPIGLMNGLKKAFVDVRAGRASASEAIDTISAGLSGTAIACLGAFLASNGLLTAKSDKEWFSKGSKFERMIGVQDYALQIGDKSYTIDWLAPSSMPLFIGAEVAKHFSGEGMDITRLLDAFANVSDPLFEMSMLKGVNDIFHTIRSGGGVPELGQIGVNAGLSLAGQFVPTVAGQLARTIDGTRRTTESTLSSGLPKQLDSFVKKQIAKVPGASLALEPYVDMLGREDHTGGLLQRAAQNFVSPGYLKSESNDPVDKYLGAMYEDMGDEVLPPGLQNSFKRDGEEYRFTPAGKTEFAKNKGQMIYSEIENLMNSDSFNALGDAEKSKKLKSIYAEAGEQAKNEYLVGIGMDEEDVWLHNYKESSEARKGYDVVRDKMSAEDYYKNYLKVQSGYKKDISKLMAIKEHNGEVDLEQMLAMGYSPTTIKRAIIIQQLGYTPQEYENLIKKVVPKGERLNKELIIEYAQNNPIDRKEILALHVSLKK